MKRKVPPRGSVRSCIGAPYGMPQKWLKRPADFDKSESEPESEPSKGEYHEEVRVRGDMTPEEKEELLQATRRKLLAAKVEIARLGH